MFKALLRPLLSTILVAGLAIPALAQTNVPEPTGTATIEEAMRPYFPDSADDLLALIKDCDSEECMSYVSGVIGGISVYAVLADNPVPFCSPASVGPSEIRDAIVSTIETTENIGGEHPALAILATFGRHWPCIKEQAVDALSSAATSLLEPEAVDALMISGRHSLVLGNPDASETMTIAVFHDPNCAHCRRFRGEVDKLIAEGWKVMIFPVATISEDSAGYAAVELAIRDSHPAAAEAIYRHGAEGPADIGLAMKIAQENGVPQNDILMGLARASAYDAIRLNTETFFEMGAKGTPSWILGNSLYSGFIPAEAILDLAATFEGDEEDDTFGAAVAPTVGEEE